MAGGAYFTDAERAALALSEAVTCLSDRADPVPDDALDEAGRHFDERELATLVLAIAHHQPLQPFQRRHAPGGRRAPGRAGRLMTPVATTWVGRIIGGSTQRSSSSTSLICTPLGGLRKSVGPADIGCNVASCERLDGSGIGGLLAAPGRALGAVRPRGGRRWRREDLYDRQGGHRSSSR